jgi:CBS domain-containing protein
VITGPARAHGLTGINGFAGGGCYVLLGNQEVESGGMAMVVGKFMSSPVISATPETTIREAADDMRTHNVGALPVIRSQRAVGILTDRDIVLRALAAPGCGLGHDTPVVEIMSRGVLTCFADQEVAAAAAVMGERRVRRLLVLDRSGAPVGVLSVCDIAEHVSEELAGQAMGEISEKRARDARG